MFEVHSVLGVCLSADNIATIGRVKFVVSMKCAVSWQHSATVNIGARNDLELRVLAVCE